MACMSKTLFFVCLSGLMLKGIYFTECVSVQEKDITMCITRNGIIYFWDNELISCLEDEEIHLTREMYDLSSYDNEGRCIHHHFKDCQHEHAYTYIDTRTRYIVSGCNGKRQCEPTAIVSSSYWDYPYQIFHQQPKCSDIPKNKIGIKIYYKCIKATKTTESSMQTKATTFSSRNSSNHSSQGSLALYVLVIIIVGIFLIILAVAIFFIYKYSVRKQQGKSTEREYHMDMMSLLKLRNGND